MTTSYKNRYLSLNILFGTIEKYDKALNQVTLATQQNSVPKRPYRFYEIRKDEENNNIPRLFNTQYDLMVVYPTDENKQFILVNEFRDNPLHGSIDSFYKSVIQNKYIGITKEYAAKFLQSQKDFQMFSNESNFSINKPIMASKSNELWCIDNLDLSMYSTQHQYNYAFVCVDVFSRKVFIEANTENTAAKALSALKKIMRRSGAKPSSILTDNGSEFKEVFDEYLTENDIKHRRTISWRPQSNGIAERANREIRKILKRLMITNGNTIWKPYLPQVETFMNNRYHSSIKRTPQEVWDARFIQGQKFNNYLGNPINNETMKFLETRAKKEIDKYKRHEYQLGDLVRVEMQLIFSNVRKLVKTGKKKYIVVWWCPRIFRISRIIVTRDAGLEPNKYELQDVETGNYLAIPAGQNIKVLKTVYATDLKPVDSNEEENEINIDQDEALILNKCEPSSTDLKLVQMP